MLLRRRLCRRGLCLLALAGAALYTFALLLGDLRVPPLAQLTELHRCPACYGVSICPELYSSQITLDPHGLRGLFNAKNVFYGTARSGKRVVLKKLGHDWELRELDRKLCAMINRTAGCQPNELLNITNLELRIAELVRFDFKAEQSEARSGLLLCPYTHSLRELLRSSGVHPQAWGGRTALLNTLATLLVNPEPIILQMLSGGGWAVPAWGGTCGRLALAAHAGEPLAQARHAPWPLRLHYARQILKAAMDFTFKHERFRFYLMDWSLDNMAADDQHRVTFVDLEDVILLDKHSAPGSDLADWYRRYTRDHTGPGFTFSVTQMCKHHLSDHNIWAACYVLAGDDPFLLPIPEGVNATRPHLEVLLKECVRGGDRFKTMGRLQQVVGDILSERVDVLR